MSNRKPAAAHRRDGTYQRCRHGTGGLRVEIPTMPEDMPASVQAVWKTVSAQLERAQIISEPDGLVLRRLCELCWIANESFDDIRANGLTMQMTNKGGHTNTVPNPNVRSYFAAIKEITAIAHKYGMTPTGRLGMSFDADAEPDEADEILSFSVN